MTNTLKKGSILPIILLIILVLTGAGIALYYATRQKLPVCGDSLCNGTETCSSCVNDCGTCPLPSPEDKSDLIRVTFPTANQEVTNLLTVAGEARGYWFFEATFPIKLLDKNGNIIARSFAQAQGEWMTEDFVPFSAEINFTVSETQNGTLVLEKDNPSDLPQNADELRIPVVLKKTEGTTRTIKLYYYNPQLDKDESENILCSRQGLVAVERQIQVTTTPIQDAIRLLIAGQLTSAEESQGITTEYPLEGFSLKGASLNNGVLTLEFQDSNNRTGGGSCRVGILWFQIEATAKQFPEAQSVRFLPEELFQP
jgi:hypothetical protein